MRVSDEQLQNMIKRTIEISSEQFANAQRAVSYYIQSEVLKQEFQEFPASLNFLSNVIHISQLLSYKQNKAITLLYGYFWVFQLLWNWES